MTDPENPVVVVSAAIEPPAPAEPKKKKRGRPPKTPPSDEKTPVSVPAAAEPDEPPTKEPKMTITKTRVLFTPLSLGDEVSTNAESEDAARERFREELRQRFLAAAHIEPEEVPFALAQGEDGGVTQAQGIKRAIDIMSYAGVVWLCGRFLGAV